MIILNVMYTAKAGMRDAFVSAVKENGISASCLSEPGCLKYSFFVPVDETDANTVFLVERYTDDEAFAYHKQQAHFKKLQSVKEMYIESTDVQICRV